MRTPEALGQNNTNTTHSLGSFVFSHAALDLLHNLDNVFVIQDMLPANLLRLVLHACSPHQGVLELLHDALVYSVTEAFYSPLALRQHHWVAIIWQLALHQAAQQGVRKI